MAPLPNAPRRPYGPQHRDASSPYERQELADAKDGDVAIGIERSKLLVTGNEILRTTGNGALGKFVVVSIRHWWAQPSPDAYRFHEGQQLFFEKAPDLVGGQLELRIGQYAQRNLPTSCQ